MIRKKEYIKSLQGLRFVLFLDIFLFHVLGILNARSTFGSWFEYSGRLGVAGFLILSGFLFALSSDSKKELSTISFEMNFFKKYYFYHFLLFVIFMPFEIIRVFNGTQNIENFLIKVLLQSTLTQSLIPRSDFYLSFNVVSWYLSTLMLIMLFSISIFKVLKKNNNLTIKKYLLLLLLFEFVLSLLLPESEFVTWLLYISAPVRLIDYTIGMCLGILYVRKDVRFKEQYKNFEIFAVILGLLILPFVNSYIPQNLTYSAIYTVLMGLLILLLADGDNYFNTLLSSKVLSKMGDISFYLYISHYAVIKYIWLLWKRLPFVNNNLIWNIIFISFTFFITCAISKAFLFLREGKKNG